MLRALALAVGAATAFAVVLTGFAWGPGSAEKTQNRSAALAQPAPAASGAEAAPLKRPELPAELSDRVEIEWRDLIPPPKNEAERDSREQMAALMGEFLGGGHSAVSIAGAGPGAMGAGEGLVEKFDEKRVRLPGYALPLDWSEEGFTQFLLVPYVGACLHVPPPPANQLVLVETKKPFKPNYVFEPVYVTGRFSRFEHEIDDIESGYRIAAEAITPYEE